MAIDTTELYKESINASTRKFKPKVEIFLFGTEEEPIIFDENDIETITLLEEASMEGASPLGAVSSNELVIVLRNDDNYFTPTYQDSPYYGRMVPDIKVVAELGIEVEPESFEYIPLGEFMTSDWSSPSQSIFATVVCHDRIHRLVSRDIPMIAIQNNTNVGKMFELLFEGLGIDSEDYHIDQDVYSTSIRWGWFPTGKVGQAFSLLSVAGNCTVSIDRLNKIRVSTNVRGGDATHMFDDVGQIFAAENPQRYANVYSGVNIKYYNTSIGDVETVLNHNDITIRSGRTVLRNVSFSKIPVVTIVRVALIGAKNAYISDITYGASSITVEIQNPGSEEEASLEVQGRVIETYAPVWSRVDSEAQAIVGEKDLDIDNFLIQSESIASAFGNELLWYVTDPRAIFELQVRGDASLEVNDPLLIVNPSDKIGEELIFVTRSQLRYDGGLSGTVQGRKIKIPHYWSMVCPGMFIYAPRPINY